MKMLLALVLAFAALCYLAACAYLYSQQRSFLYFPTPAQDAPGAEVLTFPSHGETLNILRAGPISDEAIVYFGGNAEAVSGNVDAFLQSFPDRTVYLVYYRGYGGSTGAPTESGLFKDAVTVFDRVKARHPHVCVVGRSLGSGVAVFLATQRKLDKLVLVTPYDSIEHIARKQFPMFPMNLLVKDKYASDARAPSISTPTLVLLAEDDKVIPRAHSERLIKAFRPAFAKVEVIPGTAHNSIGNSAEYWLRLRQFLTPHTRS